MREDPREPGLFDLPLDGPPAPPPGDALVDPATAPEPFEPSGAGEPRRRARPSPARTLPLFTESEVEEHLAEHLPSPEPEPAQAAAVAAHVEHRPRPVPVPRAAAADERAGPQRAPIGPRLRAAAADLGILLATGVVAAFGADRLAVPVGPGQLAPLALFVVAWSFLYFVVPLAFWGATPGMAWAGLVTRAGATEPLSFGQSAMRWLGTWLTWALAGLPGLLALSGRSLTDRLSGSATYRLEAPLR